MNVIYELALITHLPASGACAKALSLGAQKQNSK